MASFTHWAQGYEFPFAQTMVYTNSQILSLAPPQTTSFPLLISGQSQENGLCSAGVVAPDLTNAMLFSIDCAANFTSPYVCEQTTSPDSSFESISNVPSTMAGHIGYTEKVLNDSTILRMSEKVCPEGYGFMHNNTCLRLVRVPHSPVDFHPCYLPLSYDYLCTCLIGSDKYPPYYNLCYEYDNESSVYSGNAESSNSDPDDLNHYILHMLPSSSIVFQRTRSVKPLTGNMESDNQGSCMWYPQGKELMEVVTFGADFVVCSRKPTDAVVTETPDWFKTFVCADGSLISIQQQCDNVKNCPDSEDE